MKSKNRDETMIGQTVEVSRAINSEVLLKNCMGSVSFALSLLDELEARGPVNIDAIAESAAAADCDATVKATKLLNRAAVVFGAPKIQSITTNIEARARQADFGSIEQFVDDLRHEMERCFAQIPSIRIQAQTKKHDSPSTSSILENYVPRILPSK